MKRAGSVLEIPNSFNPYPLSIDEIEEFYTDTTEVRTGSKYVSPIDDIIESCFDYQTYNRNAFVLVSSRGSGTSTELCKLSKALVKNGHYVRAVNVMSEFGFEFTYTDILLLVAEAIIQIAHECKIPLEDKVIQMINELFGSEACDYNSSIEAVSEMKSSIRLMSRSREVIRSVMERNVTKIYGIINTISDNITSNTSRVPVVIFEDLEKQASFSKDSFWDLFIHHATILSNFNFPVIYTFPLALTYDPFFLSMEAYFDIKYFPLISIKEPDGTINENGINAILDIIRRRTDINIFQDEVLEIMIRKTGGLLRDLFSVIRSASQRARRRNSDTIGIEDAIVALNNLKSDLTRRIVKSDNTFLLDILNGNHYMITDRDRLIQLIQKNVIQEYNGQRWFDVHPLVVDYLFDDLHITMRQPDEEAK